jgi:hypothetical protein
MEIPPAIPYLFVTQQNQVLSPAQAEMLGEFLKTYGNDELLEYLNEIGVVTDEKKLDFSAISAGISLSGEFAEADISELQKIFLDILYEQRKPLSDATGESIMNEYANIAEVHTKAIAAATANLTSELVQASGSIVGGAVSGLGGGLGAGKLGKAGKTSAKAHDALGTATETQSSTQYALESAKRAKKESPVTLANVKAERASIAPKLADPNVSFNDKMKLQLQDFKLKGAETKLTKAIDDADDALADLPKTMRSATSDFHRAQKGVREADRMMKDAELSGQITQAAGSVINGLFRIGGAIEKNKADVLQADQAKQQSLMEINNKLYQTIQSSYANSGEDFKKTLGNLQSLVQMSSDTNKTMYRNMS